LAASAARELAWGLRSVTREMRSWRDRALSIPDATLRRDALDALERKRTHADGAALFWILPRARNQTLLRALVTYELILDFLDNVNESAPEQGEANGRQLHLALVEAVDLDSPLSDYYRYHPCKDDGGYLNALVGACRGSCSSLPSYSQVSELIAGEARRAEVLALNHNPDPALRDARLREWVGAQFPDRGEVAWFELAGAASASLTVHALLALAAEPGYGKHDAQASYDAYFPFISATSTMLDSYVDQTEDIECGSHSYVAHYPDKATGAQRLGALVSRSMREARALPDGHRHAVIVACMVAMYLSRDSAHTPAMRSTTRELIHSGGSLTRLLVPVLRMWRIVYRHRSA
jgi:tetraprenyl-beta-curcumene synthase